MKFLNTEHKKNSLIITVVLYLLMLLLLFFVGMTYLDPPPENGIAVNFGTTDTGAGNIQPTEAIKSAPKVTTPPPTSQPKTEVKEDVVTQDTEDAPVIKKEEKEVVKTIPPVKKEEPKKEPVKDPEPTPDKTTTNALDNLINGPKSEGTAKGGEGNDDTAGDKGNPNGDPNAKSYYGTGKGLDGDGNYLLGGRKALKKEKRIPDCQEEGIVVVSIEVDRTGKVIKATPGVRGTTNNSACLKDPARRAALATKFNPDTEAPIKQIGKIIYNFKLSE